MSGSNRIKIIRHKEKTERIFIDDKEIKGVVAVKIHNSTVENNIDKTSIIIEIGYIESLELTGD